MRIARHVRLSPVSRTLHCSIPCKRQSLAVSCPVSLGAEFPEAIGRRFSAVIEALSAISISWSNAPSMQTTTASCPSDETLAQWLDGRLEQVDAEALEGHAATCDACAEVKAAIRVALGAPLDDEARRRFAEPMSSRPR
jgi:hypothetical protein